jgi:hypothetical protein
MLQRAMNLKKKKNLEQFRGISFACLDNEYLSHVDKEVNLGIGNNASENGINILDLIDEEKKNYNNFVGDNPEVLLRTNLDISLNLVNEPEAQEQPIVEEGTPEQSVKDLTTPWSEVVRRKNRSKNNKNVYNVRSLLEH